MDLVAGTKRIVVLTDHVAKDGSAKIVNECTLPLTGLKVVQRIITDLAAFDITPDGLVLTQLAPGCHGRAGARVDRARVHDASSR